jgi:hypothetical protein
VGVCRKLSSQTTDTGYSSRTRTPLAALVSVSPISIFGRLRVPHAFHFVLGSVYILDGAGVGIGVGSFVSPPGRVFLSFPAYVAAPYFDTIETYLVQNDRVLPFRLQHTATARPQLASA